MADDEPLDDARAVATAAAAAAARVIETVAREGQERAARAQADLRRAQDQQTAHATLQGLSANPGWDTAARRESSVRAMAEADVPAQAIAVRATSDLMNGTNPQLAARTAPVKTGRRAVAGVAPARERGR